MVQLKVTEEQIKMYGEMKNVVVPDTMTGTDVLEFIRKTRAELIREAGGDEKKARAKALDEALSDPNAFCVGW